MKRWLAAVLALVACGGTTDLEGTGGTGPTYDDCTRSDQCVARPASCCGSCSAATRGDAIAINRDRAAAYVADKCADTGCPACYADQDATLIATCQANKCVVVDLLQHGATACSSNSDCRVRTSSCCECGGAMDRAHIVAVSNESAFTLLVCDGQACPECAPLYPTEVHASCNATGHCEPVWQ